jgi:hypothetical protein
MRRTLSALALVRSRSRRRRRGIVTIGQTIHYCSPSDPFPLPKHRARRRRNGTSLPTVLVCCLRRAASTVYKSCSATSCFLTEQNVYSVSLTASCLSINSVKI